MNKNRVKNNKKKKKKRNKIRYIIISAGPGKRLAVAHPTDGRDNGEINYNYRAQTPVKIYYCPGNDSDRCTACPPAVDEQPDCER